MNIPHPSQPAAYENDFSRRRFLTSLSGGALGFTLVNNSEKLAASEPHSHSKLRPHFAPKAKRVIWLFMHGGPSQVDLFDPKPALTRFAGQPLPESYGRVMTRRNVAKNPLLAPIKPFRPRGESGIEVSDFLPEIAQHADDLCVIRGMHGDSVNHPQSVYQMNTGNVLMGHPSVGSWVAYGLGSENKNMPAFIVLTDPGGGLKGGPPAWGSGFLPANFQGVTMRPGSTPILNMKPQPGITSEQQLHSLDFINKRNRDHWQRRGKEDELNARMNAYELAFRMQTEAPQLVDIRQESRETFRLYGIDQKETQEFGTRCLLARRMIERGVRFVQLYSGDTNGWDAHSDVASNHGTYCRRTDKPIAGLLSDLKQRGLMEDTLIIWGGEFGRMPMSEQGKGRDHNPWGYSVFLTGAGVKKGITYGETDEIGLRAVENKVHVKNFHATLLHLLGLDPLELSHPHNGLDERLIGPEDVSIVKEILA